MIGFILFTLRRTTYIGWLGSGWPEWVAMDNNPQEFNQEVNRLQSIVSFTLIFANFVPGFWLDYCRKKWNSPSGSKGDLIGLGSCYTMSALCMVIASILHAEQIELAAYVSVIMHNLGRCFGGLWIPVYFYIFPMHLYGFVFGTITVFSQPFSLLNILMLGYNTTNDDYAVMNYILGGLVSLVVLVSIACYRHYQRTKNTTNSERVVATNTNTDRGVENDEVSAL